jgi:glutaredoxin
MMNGKRYWMGAVVLAISASTGYAARVVQCVDGQGNVSFRDHCPPGMTAKEERQYGHRTGEDRNKKDLQAIADASPITLYAVPDCEVCDVARNFLEKRGLPYTEKNVQANTEVQEELKEKAGQLAIPVIVVGERVVRGYDRLVLTEAITSAGYPNNEAAPAQQEAAPTSNENTEGAAE